MIKKTILLIFIIINISFTPLTESRKRIEVAFCLDLSGSTNGLLEDFRNHLWHFVNSFYRNNSQADLQIGVVGFSRPRFGEENDYVSILSELTDHYDFVSYQLYELTATVEKGDHFVGSALYATVSELNWSKGNDSKKIVFLFGNGRVDLGRYDFREACDMAVQKNIIVYPVYISRLISNSNDLPGWSTIAEITGGKFSTMQVTKRTPLKFHSLASEYLLEMNNNLNDTYVYFTCEGAFRHHEMVEADINSTRMHEQFFYARCKYKVSDQYQSICSEWDLVSQVKNNNQILSELDNRYLPDQLKDATRDEISEVLKIKSDRREHLISKIKAMTYEIHSDSLTINSMDSIFYNTLKNYY